MPKWRNFTQKAKEFPSKSNRPPEFETWREFFDQSHLWRCESCGRRNPGMNHYYAHGQEYAGHNTVVNCTSGAGAQAARFVRI